MKRYLYVEGRDVAVTPAEGILLSFDSVFVSAVDEDAAYHLGARAILQQRADMTAAEDFGHGMGRLLNDWVVEVPND